MNTLTVLGVMMSDVRIFPIFKIIVFCATLAAVPGKTPTRPNCPAVAGCSLKGFKPHPATHRKSALFAKAKK
jgi:hypothetical protein